MRITIALHGMLLMSACASQTMGEMVGKDVTQIMAQYGPPANQFKMPDGREAFQWRIDNDYAFVTPTTTTAYQTGNMVHATTTGGNLIAGSEQCYYTLYAEKNAARSYTVTGFEKPRFMCE